MSFLNTRLGEYVNRTRRLTEVGVKNYAYSKRVLDEMKKLNLKQLDEGFYSDESHTPDYSPTTQFIKRSQGRDNWLIMNFEDTGQTRNSIEYDFKSGKLIVRIVDRYNLLEEYSQNIIGLTPLSIEHIQNEILKNIQEKFKP